MNNCDIQGTRLPKNLEFDSDDNDSKFQLGGKGSFTNNSNPTVT